MQYVSPILTPLKLPLLGEVLIEASAGTGKTFTIGLLYLRLLLGLGGKSDFVKQLSVKEILVVTFTEAAVEELRTRIRSNIHELRIACICGETSNLVFTELISQITNMPQAISNLLIAERDINDAVIFTIHGFCWHILCSKAFESGMLFEYQLLTNEKILWRQGTIEFWRSNFYLLPIQIARIIRKIWSGPDELLQTLLPWLCREELVLQEDLYSKETIEERHERIIISIKKIKVSWLSSENLYQLINKSGINHRSYSHKNLQTWLKNVTQWALTETLDYLVVKDLARFSQSELINKTLTGDSPRHPIFNQIEVFLSSLPSLRNLIISCAMKKIRCYSQKEKKLKSQIGFYDLIKFLNVALQKKSGKILKELIRKSYPVALIDEFQDTDPQQYLIFRTLYHQQPNTALLLIGDPKQAIYSFRGANIFSYIKVRSEITKHYTLNINYRSSIDMVNAVNYLFSYHTNPFIFTEIPFVPIKSVKFNHNIYFSINQQRQPALIFWLQPGNRIGVYEYQDFMAKKCAAEISYWLHCGGKCKAFLGNTKNKRAVQPSDIAILVRNKNEAAFIQKALNDLEISSVYLSNRESVFTTLAAQEILLVLKAILTPEVESTLLNALITNLFSIDITALDMIKNNENIWSSLIEEFLDYKKCWQKNGLLSMLRQLINKKKITENFLKCAHSERYLIDLWHLGEILEECSINFDNESALMRWFAKQVQKPDSEIPNQHLRIENNKSLVKIITIHKSKGLQYPLVWIPFAMHFLQIRDAIYYDIQTLTTFLDLNKKSKNIFLSEKERLAEDLRLLYVALTRAIFHCSIGIAPLYISVRQNVTKTDLHHSALGYLIQKGQAMDANGLREALKELNQNIIKVIIASSEAKKLRKDLSATSIEKEKLKKRILLRTVEDHWRVTSYSNFYYQDNFSRHVTTNLSSLKFLNFNALNAQENNQYIASEVFTIHTFPRGAKSGIFFHKLLENLDFRKLLNEMWLETQLISQGFKKEWTSMIVNWIHNLLRTPLNKTGVCLFQISIKNKKAEMPFYLPISSLITAEKLNEVIRQDPLSATFPLIKFRQVQGMLQGRIDLVFCWNRKYYIVDYKSNWLGPDKSYYTQDMIINEIREHRYDLQYQLYSLALHRYLRHRILDYNYEKNFGGVIYLFLRGIDNIDNHHGIYHTTLHIDLINALDSLFANVIQNNLNS
ncbi:exodeoxyribonuclease V subunit beta [Candidatus Erwinia haradaeae]|uniref:RecBCD enzyme subunit RecB n=1 Tax=Candidatus Erwinia haradaeae TaxID=1922217 RepID=A0A451D2D1_9GAMM|nr:exodeoxyribonuclease V subunit beta [Candidatus Erwinia haradaeae]VFP79809.1 RecBCD enzyme subunit RecB [Candidatus Erwinia haradaeae]